MLERIVGFGLKWGPRGGRIHGVRGSVTCSRLFCLQAGYLFGLSHLTAIVTAGRTVGVAYSFSAP